MPSWGDVLHELNETARDGGGQPDYDLVRRRYLANLHELTGRPTILYYSNWLDEARAGAHQTISLNDIQGFMTTVRGLQGDDLDLLLHLPGGDPHATERIPEYLRVKFTGEIRAYVPVAAMSAGTMLAPGCDRIVMGAPPASRTVKDVAGHYDYTIGCCVDPGAQLTGAHIPHSSRLHFLFSRHFQSSVLV